MVTNRWIDRLEPTPKNNERGGHPHPSKPSKPIQEQKNWGFEGFDGRGPGPFVIFYGPIHTGSDAPETKNLELIYESHAIKSPWHIEPAAAKYQRWLMATNLDTGAIVEWKSGIGDRIDRWTMETIPGSIGGTYQVSTRIDGFVRIIEKVSKMGVLPCK